MGNTSEIKPGQLAPPMGKPDNEPVPAWGQVIRGAMEKLYAFRDKDQERLSEARMEEADLKRRSLDSMDLTKHQRAMVSLNDEIARKDNEINEGLSALNRWEYYLSLPKEHAKVIAECREGVDKLTKTIAGQKLAGVNTTQLERELEGYKTVLKSYQGQVPAEVLGQKEALSQSPTAISQIVEEAVTRLREINNQKPEEPKGAKKEETVVGVKPVVQPKTETQLQTASSQETAPLTPTEPLEPSKRPLVELIEPTPIQPEGITPAEPSKPEVAKRKQTSAKRKRTKTHEAKPSLTAPAIPAAAPVEEAGKDVTQKGNLPPEPLPEIPEITEEPAAVEPTGEQLKLAEIAQKLNEARSFIIDNKEKGTEDPVVTREELKMFYMALSYDEKGKFIADLVSEPGKYKERDLLYVKEALDSENFTEQVLLVPLMEWIKDISTLRDKGEMLYAERSDQPQLTNPSEADLLLQLGVISSGRHTELLRILAKKQAGVAGAAIPVNESVKPVKTGTLAVVDKKAKAAQFIERLREQGELSRLASLEIALYAGEGITLAEAVDLLRQKSDLAMLDQDKLVAVLMPGPAGTPPILNPGSLTPEERQSVIARLYGYPINIDGLLGQQTNGGETTVKQSKPRARKTFWERFKEEFRG